MLPLLRARYAIHIAAACPATRQFPCTAAPQIWVFLLIAGPVIGLAMGTCAGGIITAQPPRQPPPEPPDEPPGEPRPDGTRAGGLLVKI
jgi:hypothetical protein